MQAKLMYKMGPGFDKEFLISKEATIGKGPKNTIVLSEELISREHARIYFDDEQQCFFLEDLRSRNGTKLDGDRVRKKERLGDLHVITFGKKTDCFFLLQKSEIPAEKPDLLKTDVNRENLVTVVDNFNPSLNFKTVIDHEVLKVPTILTERATNDIVSENKNPKTEVVMDGQKLSTKSTLTSEQAAPHQVDEDDITITPATADNLKSEYYEPDDSDTAFPPQEDKTSTHYTLKLAGSGRTYPLVHGDNMIGRSRICDVTINHGSISRQHACISIQDNAVFLNDLNSKNHTFIDKIQINTIIGISPNMTIRFGNIEAVLQHEKQTD